jgi:hypothetical protein
MPGYVRCPKCRKPLPRRLETGVQGGTAVEESPRRWPLFAVIGAVLVGVIVVVMVGRGSKQATSTPPPPVVAPEPVQEAPVVTETRQPFADDPTPAPRTGPDPNALASTLERELKRQRLWSTVTITGTRVDVRSGSCGDPAMAPMLDGAVAGFKSAGLTKLRCVEQSGRVVSDRDL